MPRLRVHAFAISLDGYGAGPDQDRDNPLGRGGTSLHQWFYPTRAFQERFGEGRGTTGIDDDFAAKGFDNIGAWIIPVRGPWPDQSWKGWWGENPPYHVPVFVLTNHARAPLEMQGGTVFHFVTDGIEDALGDPYCPVQAGLTPCQSGASFRRARLKRTFDAFSPFESY